MWRNGEGHDGRGRMTGGCEEETDSPVPISHGPVSFGVCDGLVPVASPVALPLSALVVVGRHQPDSVPRQANPGAA